MHRSGLITAMLAFALVAASCGGSGDATPQTTTSGATSPTTTTSTVGAQQATTTTTSAPPATTTTVATLQAPEGPWPSARLHPTFVHDPVSGRLLMLSGLSKMGSAIDRREIWALDTTTLTWEEVGDTKPLYTIQSFGYDPTVDEVLAFALTPNGRIFDWDPESGTWNGTDADGGPVSTGTNPRFGVPIVYDAESDRNIMFAGGSPWYMYGGTWAYDADNDAWEEMHPAISPSPRAMYGATYDEESDRVLLWGGFTGDEENDVRLWAYDYNSDSWEAMPNDAGPQQHWERHGMAYIPGIDKVLFFSGMLEEAPVFDPETWYYDYNTNTWTRLDVTSTPPGLGMYAMAYDPVTEKVYLYGGDKTSKYAGNLSDELWIFDPATEDWTLVASPTL